MAAPRYSTSAEPLAIKLAGAFAIGVALGMVRVLVRNRRRRVLVAPEEPAADAPPDPEPPASPSTDAALLPGPAVDDGEPVEDGEPVVELEPAVPAAEPFGLARRGAEPADAAPARERHTELFDAEYAQQVVRVERLREAVRGRIALGRAGGRRRPRRAERAGGRGRPRRTSTAGREALNSGTGPSAARRCGRPLTLSGTDGLNLSPAHRAIRTHRRGVLRHRLRRCRERRLHHAAAVERRLQLPARWRLPSARRDADRHS